MALPPGSFPTFREPRLLAVRDRRILFIADDPAPPLYSLARAYALNDPGAAHRDLHRQHLVAALTAATTAANDAAAAAGLAYEPALTSDPAAAAAAAAAVTASRRGKKRGSGGADLGYGARSAAAAAASQALDSAAAALAAAPASADRLLAEGRDVLTTLPLVRIALPPPLPHSDASLQRLVVQPSAAAVEDILPPQAGLTATRDDDGTVAAAAVAASELKRMHVDYFRKLRSWFSGIHGERRLRYRDRLQALGIVHDGSLGQQGLSDLRADSPRGVLAAIAGLAASPASLDAINQLAAGGFGSLGQDMLSGLHEFTDGSAMLVAASAGLMQLDHLQQSPASSGGVGLPAVGSSGGSGGAAALPQSAHARDAVLAMLGLSNGVEAAGPQPPAAQRISEEGAASAWTQASSRSPPPWGLHRAFAMASPPPAPGPAE